jgi:hypothetical protein
LTSRNRTLADNLLPVRKCSPRLQSLCLEAESARRVVVEHPDGIHIDAGTSGEHLNKTQTCTCFMSFSESQGHQPVEIAQVGCHQVTAGRVHSSASKSAILPSSSARMTPNQCNQVIWITWLKGQFVARSRQFSSVRGPSSSKYEPDRDPLVRFDVSTVCCWFPAFRGSTFGSSQCLSQSPGAPNSSHSLLHLYGESDYVWEWKPIPKISIYVSSLRTSNRSSHALQRLCFRSIFSFLARTNRQLYL